MNKKQKIESLEREVQSLKTEMKKICEDLLTAGVLKPYRGMVWNPIYSPKIPQQIGKQIDLILDHLNVEIITIPAKPKELMLVKKKTEE